MWHAPSADEKPGEHARVGGGWQSPDEVAPGAAVKVLAGHWPHGSRKELSVLPGLHER